MDSYKEALEFLYSQLPMYQRVGPTAFKKDLTNITLLCDHLHHPQKQFKSLHIAGTNGKGSVAHILTAILQIAGLKTGLYTSPHLRDFRERIKVNGQKLSKEAVISFVADNKELFSSISPSFFEMTVALAFDTFYKENVDIAIIETGLGGRFDSTNIITPILSVITNISFDHQTHLGDTLEEIAFEKAGIIKPKVPVVIGKANDEIRDVFIKKASTVQSDIYFTEDAYQTVSYEEKNDHLFMDVIINHKCLFTQLATDLQGAFQYENILTAIHAIDLLNENGYTIKPKTVRKALKQVRKLTGFDGRWHQIDTNPTIITDCAHNEAALKLSMEQLLRLDYDQLHIIFGMVNDKNPYDLLKLLPKNAIYYFCKPDILRGLDAGDLTNKASAFDLNGHTYHSVNEAVMSAKSKSNKNDLIYIGGSSFVVSEILKINR